jgi:hypothetical protein
VDPATGLPVWVEVTYEAMLEPAPTPGTTVVMRDFAFDVPLDESLFSLDPPAGYTLKVQQIDSGASSEQALIDSLKECADAHNGQFPQKFDKAQTWELVGEFSFTGAGGVLDKASQEKVKEWGRRGDLIRAGQRFVRKLSAESDWHYAGGGVKLGQAELPVCWWKPAGSQTYWMVFGDLSVRDLDKAEVDRLTAE